MENTDQYKNKLNEEMALVVSELKSIGRINPDNPNDWEAVPRDKDIWKPDEEEVADKIDGYEINNAILNQLETRYNEIKQALERIANGKFGICEVCGEAIEKERLDANPAATTCLKHVKH